MNPLLIRALGGAALGAALTFFVVRGFYVEEIGDLRLKISQGETRMAEKERDFLADGARIRKEVEDEYQPRIEAARADAESARKLAASRRVCNATLPAELVARLTGSSNEGRDSDERSRAADGVLSVLAIRSAEHAKEYGERLQACIAAYSRLKSSIE